MRGLNAPVLQVVCALQVPYARESCPEALVSRKLVSCEGCSEGSTATFAKHTFDLSSKPATGTISFTLGSKQCCLTISLYCKTTTGIEEIIEVNPDASVKWMHNGRVYILKDGKTYNIAGRQMK